MEGILKIVIEIITFNCYYASLNIWRYIKCIGCDILYLRFNKKTITNLIITIIIGLVFCTFLRYSAWAISKDLEVENIEIEQESKNEKADKKDKKDKKPKKDIIKWVDFNVPCEAMKKAISLDIISLDKDIHLNYIEMLAYLAAKNGNNFTNYNDYQLDELAETLSSGKSMQELTKDMKYYNYYYE